MDAWVFCSCGHLSAEHAAGGKCRATSLNHWPCECPQFDSDDPPSDFRHVSPVGDGGSTLTAAPIKDDEDDEGSGCTCGADMHDECCGGVQHRPTCALSV